MLSPQTQAALQTTFQRGSPPTRGRERGRWNNSNKPKCQICEKTGHTAPRCFYGFNANFAVNQNPRNQRGSNPTANLAQAKNDGAIPSVLPIINDVWERLSGTKVADTQSYHQDATNGQGQHQTESSSHAFSNH